MLNIVGQKKIIKSKWQRHCHIPFKMAWKIKIKVKKKHTKTKSHKNLTITIFGKNAEG